MNKHDRLRVFVSRMNELRNAKDKQEALAQVKATLNAVEDELSGMPYNPELWMSDGRPYPPLEDSERTVAGREDLTRFRSRDHHTFVGRNGAIKIVSSGGEVLLDKAGGDGKRIDDS